MADSTPHAEALPATAPHSREPSPAATIQPQTESVSIAGRIRAGRRFGAIGLLTACMFGAWRLRRLMLPGERVAEVREGWMRTWAHWTAKNLGVRTELEAPSLPASPGGRLVIANHRCAADIPILLSTFGGRLLSRADLANWPVVGPLAREVETLFVDREDQRSGATAIRNIRAVLRAGGTVIVFPEGTTFQGDEVRPFHAGAFAAAKGLTVDIIPVGFAYPPQVEWWKVPFGTHIRAVASRKTTPVAITVGIPERLAGRKTSEATEQLRDSVQALVHRSRTTLAERHDPFRSPATSNSASAPKPRTPDA